MVPTLPTRLAALVLLSSTFVAATASVITAKIDVWEKSAAVGTMLMYECPCRRLSSCGVEDPNALPLSPPSRHKSSANDNIESMVRELLSAFRRVKCSLHLPLTETVLHEEFVIAKGHVPTTCEPLLWCSFPLEAFAKETTIRRFTGHTVRAAGNASTIRALAHSLDNAVFKGKFIDFSLRRALNKLVVVHAILVPDKADMAALSLLVYVCAYYLFSGVPLPSGFRATCDEVGIRDVKSFLLSYPNESSAATNETFRRVSMFGKRMSGQRVYMIAYCIVQPTVGVFADDPHKTFAMWNRSQLFSAEDVRASFTDGSTSDSLTVTLRSIQSDNSVTDCVPIAKIPLPPDIEPPEDHRWSYNGAALIAVVGEGITLALERLARSSLCRKMSTLEFCRNSSDWNFTVDVYTLPDSTSSSSIRLCYFKNDAPSTAALPATSSTAFLLVNASCEWTLGARDIVKSKVCMSIITCNVNVPNIADDRPRQFDTYTGLMVLLSVSNGAVGTPILPTVVDSRMCYTLALTCN